MKQSVKYTRPLSFNERFFLVFDEMCPPVANQLIFEGSGVLDKKRWEQAVKTASEANPGSRVVLKGRLGRSRWIDTGKTPTIREADGSLWDAMGPDNAPFLKTILPYREGPSCEVLLIHGNPLRVAFRTHHAVMDGRGTMTWAEDIFRVLRGEEPIGSTSILTDTELAREIQKETRKPYPVEHIAPTGSAQGSEEGMTWKRKRLTGTYPNALGQIAVLTAKEAWRHHEGVVRFSIPVDMRQHQKGLRSTGNLSFAIYIEVRPETTPEQVAAEVEQQVRERREGMLTPGDDLYRHIPIKLMAEKTKKIIARRHENNLYSMSGVLTNMGRIPLQYFSGGGFNTDGLFGIPPTIEYFPFFLGLGGYGNIFEMILTVPKVLATNGRLEDTFNRISANFRPAEKPPQ